MGIRKKEVICDKELTELTRKYPNIHYRKFFDLNISLNDLYDQINISNTEFYIAGSQPMETTLLSELTKGGVLLNNIHIEVPGEPKIDMFGVDYDINCTYELIVNGTSYGLKQKKKVY